MALKKPPVGFPRAAVDFLNWIGGLDQNEIDKLVFGWAGRRLYRFRRDASSRVGTGLGVNHWVLDVFETSPGWRAAK